MCILVVASWLFLAAAPAAGAERSTVLVGTWQPISRIDRDSNGNLIPESSLGADPVGYLIYDVSGHVAVQLMSRRRGADPCQVTAPAKGNNLAQVGGYEAYFGRYEVDQPAGTVTHSIEGAMGPADVGRRLTRRFKIEGDILTIQFEPGQSGDQKLTRTVVWKRVSP